MRGCHYGDVNAARNILEQARVEASLYFQSRGWANFAVEAGSPRFSRG